MTQTQTLPEPGIYRGLSMEEYHAWPAASNSRLSQLLRSPAHCKAAMDEQFQDTEALAFGRAAHCAILEPQEFDKRYALATQCHAYTQRGGQCSREGSVSISEGRTVCSQHRDYYEDPKDGREVLSAADWQHCLGMSAAIRDIPVAHNLLLALGDIELSILWSDNETGVQCKLRLDGISDALPGGCIVDLKTTRDASRAEFEKAVARYQYHMQAAMYLEGAAAVGMPARHYVFVSVEKVPPYGVGLYRLTEGAIEAGADQLRKLLPKFGECLKSGIWSGYSDQIEDIDLPLWARKDA